MLGKARALTYLGRNHRGDRDHRRADCGSLVRRRRALLAGAQRKRARPQRRGLGRRRGGGEAAGQRAGAEARRPHRLSPPAAGAGAGEVRRIAHRAIRTTARPRSISASCSRSSERGRRTADVLTRPPRCLEGNDKAYNEEIASIQASGDPPARQGGQDRAARAVHRQRAPADRHVVVRHRGGVLQPRRAGAKRGSSPKRSRPTSSSASGRATSWPASPAIPEQSSVAVVVQFRSRLQADL